MARQLLAMAAVAEVVVVAAVKVEADGEAFADVAETLEMRAGPVLVVCVDVEADPYLNYDPFVFAASADPQTLILVTEEYPFQEELWVS